MSPIDGQQRTLRITNNPDIIKSNVKRIFSNNKHASVIGQQISGYFRTLEERDIIRSYKISINDVVGKLHISWKWIYGSVSFTLPLNDKITILPQKVNRNYKENN